MKQTLGPNPSTIEARLGKQLPKMKLHLPNCWGRWGFYLFFLPVSCYVLLVFRRKVKCFATVVQKKLFFLWCQWDQRKHPPWLRYFSFTWSWRLWKMSSFCNMFCLPAKLPVFCSILGPWNKHKTCKFFNQSPPVMIHFYHFSPKIVLRNLPLLMNKSRWKKPFHPMT